MKSEAELVAGLRVGDQLAFAEAFERFADRLYRVALGVVGDSDDAEDIVQEAFVALVDHIDRFEERSRLSTWLYRVAYNAALQRYRSRHRTSGREAAGSAASEVPDGASGPGEIAEAGEFSEALWKALAGLPEGLRIAFLLRDVEGMSTVEAADLLELSPGALKVRLHRARLRLRDALSSEVLPPTTNAGGISCAEVTELLSDYLAGDLPPETRTQIETHVAQCDHCRVMVDSTRRVLEVAGASRHVVLPERSGEMFDRLAAVFASRPPAQA